MPARHAEQHGALAREDDGADAVALLEAVATAIGRLRGRTGTMTMSVRPREIAEVLGHRDGGSRIRAFLRDPDDGGPPVPHRAGRQWELSVPDAARVVRRFDTADPRRGLSDREREVVELYVEGASVPEVAERLDVGQESVRTYLRRARAKLSGAGLEVSSRAELRARMRGER